MNATMITTPDISGLLMMFTRFATRYGFQPLGSSALPAFAAQPGSTILLLTDDPKKNPETWDVAVVLPDLVAAFAHGSRVGLLDPATSRTHALRYGVYQWPSLVFLRDGEYLGVIARMRDWTEYAELIPKTLNLSPSTPPAVEA